MIIDGHAHACGDYWTAENIMAAMDQNNIAKVILCPGEKDSNKSYNFPNFKTDYIYTVNKMIGYLTRLSGAAKHLAELNCSVYSLCRKNPDRLLQGYWIDPGNDQVMQILTRDWDEYRFPLLKVHQCWSDFRCCDAGFRKTAAWALSQRIPLFIHLKTRQDARELIQFCNDRRDNVVIVAHLIGIEEFVKEKHLSANVFFDISCPRLIPLEKVKMAAAHFGPRRLLFGTDIPYGKNNIRLNIDRVNGLDITPPEKDAIFGDNLLKLLPLRQPS